MGKQHGLGGDGEPVEWAVEMRRFDEDATLDRLHCFCECKESPREHHKTLLTCYTSNHAAGCGICLKEALMAAELKEKGLPDDQIENTVESVFKTDGHKPTGGHPG